MRTLGPRAHHGHVAAQDVPQLWELIQRGPAKEPSDPGHPAVVLDRPFRHRFVLVDRAHGAELEKLEWLAIAPNSHLPEEDSRTSVEPHRQSAHQNHRRQQDQGERTNEDVEDTLALPWHTTSAVVTQ